MRRGVERAELVAMLEAGQSQALRQGGITTKQLRAVAERRGLLKGRANVNKHGAEDKVSFNFIPPLIIVSHGMMQCNACPNRAAVLQDALVEVLTQAMTSSGLDAEAAAKGGPNGNYNSTAANEMSVRQLRRELARRGLEHKAKACTEKSELVQLLAPAR
eukprot:SAG11_NODE_47_length_20431_cov_7.472752_3_plen_160_part_00